MHIFIRLSGCGGRGDGIVDTLDNLSRWGHKRATGVLCSTCPRVYFSLGKRRSVLGTLLLLLVTALADLPTSPAAPWAFGVFLDATNFFTEPPPWSTRTCRLQVQLDLHIFQGPLGLWT